MGTKIKKVPMIEKEYICRVGEDWQDKCLFINALDDLKYEIPLLVSKELNLEPHDLHNLTVSIKKFNTPSVVGDNKLTEKVLKLKLRITLEECELIDDFSPKKE